MASAKATETCSLDGDGYRERLAAWREPLRDARGHREQREAVWSLAPDRAGVLAEPVTAERSRRAFLDPRVENGEAHVLLRVGLRSGRRPAPGSRVEEAARLLGAPTDRARAGGPPGTRATVCQAGKAPARPR